MYGPMEHGLKWIERIGWADNCDHCGSIAGGWTGLDRVGSGWILPCRNTGLESRDPGHGFHVLLPCRRLWAVLESWGCSVWKRSYALCRSYV